jgi:hypothetical protein
MPPSKCKMRLQLLSKRLKYSSSTFAIAGGSLLAANIPHSGYGFALLLGSSTQLLLSSVLVKDWGMVIYAASLVIFVDSFGVYRWLLT